MAVNYEGMMKLLSRHYTVHVSSIISTCIKGRYTAKCKVHVYWASRSGCNRIMRLERGKTGPPVAKIITRTNYKRYQKAPGLWQLTVSIYNMVSRIRHGFYGRVERQALLLKTHMSFARSCCPSIALVSLHIQRLHKLY